MVAAATTIIITVIIAAFLARKRTRHARVVVVGLDYKVVVVVASHAPTQPVAGGATGAARPALALHGTVNVDVVEIVAGIALVAHGRALAEVAVHPAVLAPPVVAEEGIDARLAPGASAHEAVPVVRAQLANAAHTLVQLVAIVTVERRPAGGAVRWAGEALAVAQKGPRLAEIARAVNTLRAALAAEHALRPSPIAPILAARAAVEAAA